MPTLQRCRSRSASQAPTTWCRSSNCSTHCWRPRPMSTSTTPHTGRIANTVVRCRSTAPRFPGAGGRDRRRGRRFTLPTATSATRWSVPATGYTVEHSVHVGRRVLGKAASDAALMEALFDRAAAAGVHVMIGAIDSSNVDSIRFHERLGFVETARMPEVGRKFDPGSTCPECDGACHQLRSHSGEVVGQVCSEALSGSSSRASSRSRRCAGWRRRTRCRPDSTSPAGRRHRTHRAVRPPCRRRRSRARRTRPPGRRSAPRRSTSRRSRRLSLPHNWARV